MVIGVSDESWQCSARRAVAAAVVELRAEALMLITTNPQQALWETVLPPGYQGLPVGHPDRPGGQRHSGARWRATRVRRYGRTDLVQITERSACRMDRFAAEPCGSFWCATTSRAPATATIAVMGSRW